MRMYYKTKPKNEKCAAFPLSFLFSTHLAAALERSWLTGYILAQDTRVQSSRSQETREESREGGPMKKKRSNFLSCKVKTR
uniref:Putative secreted peptide n=1 Tax=Anopheles braziliensis TaxID=58242 RepID=A0A2M3ZQC9_9DIPT